LRQQPAIASDSVVDRGWEGSFRRKPIVERQHAGLRRPGDPRDHIAMSFYRPDYIAAAVEVEHEAVVRSVRRADPFGVHAARVD